MTREELVARAQAFMPDRPYSTINEGSHADLRWWRDAAAKLVEERDALIGLDGIGVDRLLERFDQTEPAIQRGIVAKVFVQCEEMRRERDAMAKRLADVEDELRGWFGCPSCGERHDKEIMCPPHEVRTTGQAWFHARLAEAKQREDDLRTRLAESQQQLQTVHNHVKEALELLGVDLSLAGYIPDSWTLREQCHLAKQSLAEIEAACAAMRLALESAQDWYADNLDAAGDHDEACGVNVTKSVLVEALASNAGKAVLAKLAEAEAGAMALRTIVERCVWEAHTSQCAWQHNELKGATAGCDCGVAAALASDAGKDVLAKLAAAEAGVAAWKLAWDDARDCILNARHQLAETEHGGYEVNDILGVLDDREPSDNAGKAFQDRLEQLEDENDRLTDELAKALDAPMLAQSEAFLELLAKLAAAERLRRSCEWIVQKWAATVTGSASNAGEREIAMACSAYDTAQ